MTIEEKLEKAWGTDYRTCLVRIGLGNRRIIYVVAILETGADKTAVLLVQGRGATRFVYIQVYDYEGCYSSHFREAHTLEKLVWEEISSTRRMQLELEQVRKPDSWE